MTSTTSTVEHKTDIQHREIDMPTEDVVAHHAAQMHVNTMPSHLAKLQPAPIGFGAFALCSFILGLYNSGLVTDLPQVAVGVAFGYGAMGQFVCGICELVLGNIFAATTMLTFSGFFFTFGIMMIPSSGFLELAMTSGGLHAVHVCMGLVQVAFAIASFFFFLGTLRQPILIRLVLFQVFLTFLLGGIGGMAGIEKLTIAGGWVSFTLSITAWYVMCALLYTPDHTMIKLPFF